MYKFDRSLFFYYFQYLFLPRKIFVLVQVNKFTMILFFSLDLLFCLFKFKVLFYFIFVRTIVNIKSIILICYLFLKQFFFK